MKVLLKGFSSQAGLFDSHVARFDFCSARPLLLLDEKNSHSFSRILQKNCVFVKYTIIIYPIICTSKSTISVFSRVLMAGMLSVLMNCV